MDYKRESQIEWEWQQGVKTYSVRVFPNLGTLIWSSRAADGMQFDDGIRQQIELFMANGAPQGITPPEALLIELREFLPTPRGSEKRGGLFGWLRGSVRDWRRGKRDA